MHSVSCKVRCNLYRVISGIVSPSRLVDPLMIVDLSCSPAPARGGHDKIRTKTKGADIEYVYPLA